VFARRQFRRVLLVGAAALMLPLAIPDRPAPIDRHAADEEALEGRDEREPVPQLPSIAVAASAESYRPGATATVISFDSARRVVLQLFRVGDARGVMRAGEAMRGVPVSAPHSLAFLRVGDRIGVPLAPNLKSGLYFVRVTGRQSRVGCAPFVVSPSRLGEHRVAVVVPTETWQAYNFRDDDADGDADTWYASPAVHTALLVRPFEGRGVPPHYRYYDEPFLRWLDHYGYRVDYLSDADLRATSGAQLRRAYRLLIFEGHHEYVTAHEYDAVTTFRNRGGNLVFLSANNFFYEITLANHVMTRVGKWRDGGRPEAALIGTQYATWDAANRGGHPWKLVASNAGRWIFRGTGLHPGDSFSSGGIEIDTTAPASPPGVQVLATIANPYGDGHDARMTYYETRSGAHVFAAGAFSLACAVWQPPVSRVVANLIYAFSDGRSIPARSPVE
jgi:hypothetical protein